MPISTKPSNAVKADAGEITKSLRWLARETEFVFAAEQLNAAAALIDSLQEQLAEAQQQFIAAVNDLNRMADGTPCTVCRHKSRVPCTTSQHADCFEWRGSQDEKGE